MAKLALKGGTPIRTEGFFKWPYTDYKDNNILNEVYDSEYYGINGKQSCEFSRRFAKYNETEYCIPVANGTTSLELILRGLGIGRGDEVIIQGYTFIATLSAIIYAGATPVFCDIEKDTYGMSASSVEDKITSRTKAIIPVYVSGRPADMDKLLELANKKGIYLIGDAAQAVGSAWCNKSIGSYCIAASFSCQNSKNLTCGEGGIITTNSVSLYNNILTILNGGLDEEQYTHIGLNYNMSEWQAGILNTQFDKLDSQIELRMKNASYLDYLLYEFEFISPLKSDSRITKNSYHFYTVRINEQMLKGVSRDNYIRAVNAEGIPLVNGYTPLYHAPFLKSGYIRKTIGKDIDIDINDVPNTEFAYKHECGWIYSSEVVMLSKKEDIDDIAEAMYKVYKNIDELR